MKFTKKSVIDLMKCGTVFAVGYVVAQWLGPITLLWIAVFVVWFRTQMPQDQHDKLK
jgi:hypothetical protein